MAAERDSSTTFPSINEHQALPASETKRFTKPLFPGYVFARIPEARKGQDLPAGPARARDRRSTTRRGSSAQLEDVRKIVSSGVELTVIPLLDSRGRRVRVVGGPLHGLEGLVDDCLQSGSGS
jgi:transcriptional antiterminator RfaH